MKIYLILFLFIFFGFSTICQQPIFEWNNHYYSYAFPISISNDFEKNVIVVGEFSSTIDFDPGSSVFNLTSHINGSLFIQKLDSLGNLIWVKKIDNQIEIINGGINYMDVINDNYGNIIVCSEFKGIVDFNLDSSIYLDSSSTNAVTGQYSTSIFISKYSPSGDLFWVKKLELDQEQQLSRKYELYVDDFDEIYLVGDFGLEPSDLDPGPNTQIFNPFNPPIFTSFILKLDSQGNHIYSNIYPITSSPYNYDSKHSSFVDSDGTFYLSGQFDSTIDIDITNSVNNISPLGNTDGIFAKYDPNGQLLWHKVLTALNQSVCFVDKLEKSIEGFIYVHGSFNGSVDFDPSSQNYFLNSGGGDSFFFGKYTSNGDLIWVKQLTNIDNLGSFELRNLQPLNGGWVVLSFCPSGYFQFDIDPGVNSVLYSSENDYYGVILIIDQNGNYQWSKQFLQDDEDFAISDLFVNYENEIFMCGGFGGIINFDPSNVSPPLIASTWRDGFLVKYSFDQILGINSIEPSGKSLIKVFDILGRETNIKTNQLLIYQYDDGTTEKKVVMEY